VVIEERAYDEVVRVKGRRIAPKGVPVANPAFDKTPPELVTAIITDLGLVQRPVEENLRSVIG
jgi:methylthioribose-1-phosphate isomerase